MNKDFKCDCGGPVKVVSAELVEHVCGCSIAPGTSYYDGVGRYIPYRRVLLNPEVTGGAVKYNWFVDWH